MVFEEGKKVVRMKNVVESIQTSIFVTSSTGPVTHANRSSSIRYTCTSRASYILVELYANGLPVHASSLLLFD